MLIVINVLNVESMLNQVAFLPIRGMSECKNVNEVKLECRVWGVTPAPPVTAPQLFHLHEQGNQAIIFPLI